MSIFKKILSVIASISLHIFLLGVTVYSVIFSKGYLMGKYRSYGVAASLDISEDDLGFVTKSILSFLKGRLSSLADIQVTRNGQLIDFFRKIDLQHLDDLSVIINKLQYVIVFSATIAILAYAFLCIKKATKDISLGLLISDGIFILLIGLVGVFAAVDLRKLINVCHSLFFKKMNWILNPAKDNLIHLCPTQLFVDSGILLAAVWGAFFVVTIAVSIVLLRLHRSKK